MNSPEYRALTAEAAQGRGHMYCSTGEYSLALEAFSAAFELSGRKSLSALEGCVATYEKLAQWPDAYREATLLIALRPDDLAGYSRAAKILCRIGKQNSAARIYSCGSDRGGGRDARYSALRATADAAPQALAVPERGLPDPFRVLPTEVSLMVAVLFSFKTLVLCLRVSKSWNRFLSSLVSLWKNVDLSLAQHAVGEEFIASCVRRSKGTLTRALLQHTAYGDTGLRPILSQIATRCKNLKHLEILGVGSVSEIIDTIPMAQNLNTLILHSATTPETGGMLLRNCPNLVHVEFHRLLYLPSNLDPWPNNLERIRKLYLRYCSTHSKVLAHILILGLSVADAIKQHLLDKTLSLRELALVDWRDVPAFVSHDYSKMSHLESLHITNCDIHRIPLLPRTIRHLTICTDWSLRTRSRGIFRGRAVNNMNQLTSLILHEIFNIELTDILGMLCEDSSLKLLHIIRCLGVSRIDLLQVLTCTATKHVVDLALVDMVGIDDDLVGAISDMTDLKFLDVSGNTTLNGAGVKRLISKSGVMLNKLGLSGCINVGRDAVDRARQMGIKVGFKYEVREWFDQSQRYFGDITNHHDAPISASSA